MTAILIRGARPWGGEPCDLLASNGFVAAREPRIDPPPGAEVVDGTGCLLLPGLVDGHTHLDKTLIGTPWLPHSAGPRLVDRIENERRVLAELELDPARQSARMVRHMLARGTTHIRSHADVAPDTGLAHVEGLLATRDACRDWVDLQVVAFPQQGVMVRPGTLDLLDAAVGAGADALGGLDPVGIDRDPKGQLDALFDIAGRRGCELDIHLHDRGEMGAVTIEMIVERALALGLVGKVALSHAYCLGDLDESRLAALAARLYEADVAVMTAGVSGDWPIPPVRTLCEAGVRMFSGSDGVRDAWSPLNNGDMLERAYQLAWHSDFNDDPGIELALQLATFGGAEVMGVTDYGLEQGCRADLVMVEAETAAEAVCYHPPRRLVLKDGRVVARDGRCLLPPL